MGYRSHGNLAFPTVFLGLYKQMCPKTPLDEWDSVSENSGYTLLEFSDWKWYGSYEGVAELEAFMDKLDMLYDTYEFADRPVSLSSANSYPEETEIVRRGTVLGNKQKAQLDKIIGQLPFEIMVKEYPWFLPILESNGVGTINMWEPKTYKPQEWVWGFNMQGEDLDDYETKGQPEEMGGYQDGSVANMWYYDGGQAWKYTFSTATDRDYFAACFNQVKAGTDIKMDIFDHTKRFEIILHSDTTHSLWDQSKNRAGTDLSDPQKSFVLDNTQYQENDLAFAIWDEHEIIKSQGDIYEMDISERRSAGWSFNDNYFISLPESYLKAVEKEYESP